MQKVIMMVPDEIRIGQQIFNFLEWLRVEKDMRTPHRMDSDTDCRLADTFYIQDDEWNRLYAEFLKQHNYA